MERIPRFRRRPKHPTIKTDTTPSTSPAPAPDRDRDRDNHLRDVTPPPPLPQPSALPTPKTSSDKFLKVASLKGLHLRSPHKRARSPAVAASAAHAAPVIVSRVVSSGSSPSPSSSSAGKDGDGTESSSSTVFESSDDGRSAREVEVVARKGFGEKKGGRSGKGGKGKRGGGVPGQRRFGRHTMPSFLNQSDSALSNKFQEIIWIERNRVAFGPPVLVNIDPRTNPSQPPNPNLVGMDRYCNIKPWKHNRVKLHVPDGTLDYINASPIVLESPTPPTSSHSRPTSSSSSRPPPLRYIAMQGPTQQSLEYAWRMIAEQGGDPAVIVQLTNMFENGYQKCFPYYPTSREDPGAGSWRINTRDTWGDGWAADLRYRETKILADGAIELTKLSLRVVQRGDDDGENEEDKKGKERTVWHFLYTRWPDFGVPAMEDLDSFFELMRLSRAYAGHDTSAPRIIHCSAGVGRTGTFIALEHLMRELEAGVMERDAPGEVGAQGQDAAADPVFELVDALRAQRKSMVQAEPQFAFIYRVMRKLWIDKYAGDQGEDGAGSASGEEPAPKRLELDGKFLE